MCRFNYNIISDHRRNMVKFQSFCCLSIEWGCHRYQSGNRHFCIYKLNYQLSFECHNSGYHQCETSCQHHRTFQYLYRSDHNIITIIRRYSTSSNFVATVTNGGIVTGVSTGSATFTFINSTTLCSSDATASVSVSAAPNLTVSGPDFVCESSNISLLASLAGGTWSSSNTLIATVSNTGIVTGISDGSATITYTYVSGACTSIINKTITVLDKPVITLTGSNAICAGQTTTFTLLSGRYVDKFKPGCCISQLKRCCFGY
ncbi:MAG: Ig-like domain-containing protein [Saprospiraceae bacterium]|nr:Ig-like domain-containing protein [Saprospiraceae bacterium]